MITTTRREFMVLGGGGLLALGWQPHVHAGTAPAVSPILVHDPDLAVPPEFLARLQGEGGSVFALSDDPVRLWRAGLRERVAAGAALYGLTLWPDLLIFRGLGAELRRHAREVRAESGDRFAWIIA